MQKQLHILDKFFENEASSFVQGETLKVMHVLFLSFMLAFGAIMLVPETAVAATTPELPRIYINTSYPSMSSNRTIYTVANSCAGKNNCFTSVQAAVDASKLGDEIIVTAGEVFTGSINLKNKTSGKMATGSVSSVNLSLSLKIGDINQDNIVNSLDFSMLNAKWFQADSARDLNQDGIINSLDFSLLNKNWFVQGDV